MSATTTQAAHSLADMRGVGTQVAKAAGGRTVAAFFDANKGSIAAVLPHHMTADRMTKIALRALRTTPKLMDCKVESLFGAVITCAQLGLEPNTPQGHIYLIPFDKECQVVVGYKGLIDLARRSGQIVSISARIVAEHDAFSIDYGTEEVIIHKPRLDGERGRTVGVYAVAKLKDGGTQFEFMSVLDVNRVRDESAGYKSALYFAKKFNKPPRHPWIQHYDEMARKTAIRRLCKYLPMSIELAGAVDLDSRAEGGKPQGLERVLEGVDYTSLNGGDDAPTGDDEAYDAETGEVTQAQPAAVAKAVAPLPTAAERLASAAKQTVQETTEPTPEKEKAPVQHEPREEPKREAKATHRKHAEPARQELPLAPQEAEEPPPGDEGDGLDDPLNMGEG